MDFDSKDLFYYKEYRDKFRPSYDYENLIITAGCMERELSYEKSKLELRPDELKYHGNFIHEFTHHLQNFSTTWGASTFADFILAYLKISASGLSDKEKLKLPVSTKDINNDLLKAGFDGRRQVLFKLNKGTILEEIGSKSTNVKIEIDNANELILFSNGRVRCSLGVMAIREHMATIATLLFWEHDDEKAYQHLKSFSGFIDENGEMAFLPQYWIAYIFFHENYHYEFLASGLFQLAKECLTRLNPDKAFFRFMTFWIKHPDKLLIGCDFRNLIVNWINTPEEIQSYLTSFNLTCKHVEKRLQLVDKIGSGHDLGRSSKKILEGIYWNINTTHGGRYLLDNTSVFKDLEFWLDQIVHFGTPIISFSDNTTIKGDKQYCDNLMQPFVSVNSVSMTIKKLFEDPEFQCPFLFDIPICRVLG